MMKHSTDDIIKELRLFACGSQYELLATAADRLQQLTMPDDATFARIVDAMESALSSCDSVPCPLLLRNAYRAAIRAVES